MAHYTTRLRSILETYAGYDTEQDFDKIDEIIAKTHKQIFTKDYALFDPDYKSVIESKILYHYYMREIGAETVGLFKYYINRTMTEIMPYYSQLYESAALKFNPLFDTDYYREGDRVGTEDGKHDVNTTGSENRAGKDTGTIKDAGTRNNNVNTSNNQKDKFSDTPQNGLSQVENDQYLTTYRNVIDAGNTTENGTDNNTRTLDTLRTDNASTASSTNATDDIDTTEKWLEHIYGKMPGASYSKLLQEYRDTLLNIDEMVIKEFEKCFFMLV